MVYFEKAFNKIKANGSEKFIGGVSAVCLLLIVNLLSLILTNVKGWVVFMVFCGAIYFFFKLHKVTEEIFEGWCEDVPFFVHAALIVATLITAKPLIVKYYGEPTTEPTPNE